MGHDWQELTKLVGQARIEIDRVRIVDTGVAIEGPFTPIDRWFTTQHYGHPVVDPATFRLKVTGLVERPLSLSLDELRPWMDWAEGDDEATAAFTMRSQQQWSAGLEWTFVRIRYASWNTDGFRARYWSDPWAIDGPAAEQNLSRRLKSVTAIKVNEPIVLTLEDPQLWAHPWIYFVEPGNLLLTETEVPILREFLLRGGTAVMDDFHLPRSRRWPHLASGSISPRRRTGA